MIQKLSLLKEESKEREDISWQIKSLKVKKWVNKIALLCAISYTTA